MIKSGGFGYGLGKISYYAWHVCYYLWDSEIYYCNDYKKIQKVKPKAYERNFMGMKLCLY